LPRISFEFGHFENLDLNHLPAHCAMIRMFNSYIKSKLEYCILVWSPWHQKEINKLERIQKNVTSKIEGMEQLDYHQRLKKLNLYSLESRR